MKRRGARWLALWLLALVTLATYHRVLAGWAWLPPAGAAAVVGSWIAGRLATMRLWRATALAATAALGWIYLIYVIFPETLSLGLPTLGSLQAVADSTMGAVRQVETAIPPVAPDPGTLALLVSAAWLAGALSGVLPGRTAAVPWLVLFGFPAGLGVPEGRYPALMAFLAAALVFFLASSAERGRGPIVAGPALRMATLTILLALTVPTLLPGYGAAGTLIPQEVAVDRTVLSPMVEIRPRLVQSSNTVLFTVRANAPVYWRLAGLDDFDGERWRLKGEFNASQGALAPAFPPGGTTVALEQEITIHSLGGAWLPAAFSPRRVEGVPTLYEPERDTLIVDRLSPGVRYRVSSVAPRPSAAELEAAAQARRPPEGSLDLPDDLPPQVLLIARLIVGDAPSSPYRAALALQEHLRTFTYSLEVPAGHGENELLRFLTETKAGYCEQFAAAMAVMARSIGLPARVAVGFLPGTPDEDGAFVVTGREAHAWPEIFFDGIGWVAFEPTPRSESEPPGYAGPPAGPGFTEEGPLPQGPVEAGEIPAEPPVDAGSTPLDVARRASIRLLAATAGLMILLVASRILGLWLLRRGSADPRRAVTTALAEFQLVGASVLRTRMASETEMEYAGFLAAEASLDVATLRTLIGIFQKAEYGTEPPSPEEARMAARAAARLTSEMLRKSPPWIRLKVLGSPRPLVAALQREAPLRRLISSSSAARSV